MWPWSYSIPRSSIEKRSTSYSSYAVSFLWQVGTELITYSAVHMEGKFESVNIKILGGLEKIRFINIDSYYKWYLSDRPTWLIS